jgi:hypothetical protein
MTPDIERLAKEAGIDTDGSLWRSGYEDGVHMDVMAKFAALIAEEAAKVCDTTPPHPFRPSMEAGYVIRQKFPMPKGEA